MLNLNSSIEQLLNPCRISSSRRSATYTQAESARYSSSQEIRFSLPQESLDLSNAFLDMNVNLIQTDDEVPEVYLIDAVVNPGVYPLADAGSFNLRFGTEISRPISFDTTCEELEDIINAITTFSGREFDITCADAGAVAPYTTGTNNFFDGIQIITSGFYFSNLPSKFGWEILNSSLTLAGVYVPTTLRLLQEPDFIYPRLEKGNPLISAIRCDIDGTNIINLNQTDILAALCTEFHSTADRYYDLVTGAESENGSYSEGSFYVKLNFTDFMSLFRKVLPMDLIGRQLRLYLTLNSPRKCLIWKSPNADYEVSNVEFHYNRVDFSSQEKSAIMTELANNTLVIPYVGYSNYSSTFSQGTTSQDVLFNPGSSGLLGVLCVMQPQDYIADPTNIRKSSIFLKNKLFSARLKTGSVYHPLDILKSISPDKDDIGEYLEELLNVTPYITGEQSRDLRIIYNYRGNYTENNIYVDQWNNTFVPTFCIGISTAASPHDVFGHFCAPGKAYSGLDVSKMTDVRLELRGLELQETTLVQIFSIEQEYLVFGNNYFERIR